MKKKYKRKIGIKKLLPTSLLQSFRNQASLYDKKNVFFHEDLRVLKKSRYLKLLIPIKLGGLGFNFYECVLTQQRLATAAPATALGVNMHLIWSSIATILCNNGDHSLEFIIKEIANDEIFAFGISEPRNDNILRDSKTVALQLKDKSYSFTGTKIFTSLSPVWTKLGIVGKEKQCSNRSNDKLIYGFLNRNAKGILIKNTWDTLGMRATQSQTTILKKVIISKDKIFRKIDTCKNDDKFIFALFICFEILTSSIYIGIGQRSLFLAVQKCNQFTNKILFSYKYLLAQAASIMDSLYIQLEFFSKNVDKFFQTKTQSYWLQRLAGFKIRVADSTRKVNDIALQIVGGQSYFNGHELERLHRDVIANIFHPSNKESTYNLIFNSLIEKRKIS